MDLSFYNAASGMTAHQKKLDHVANNLANVNTNGYKTKRAGFVDLLYQNIRNPETEVNRARQGSGARVEKTDIIFEQSSLDNTERPLDFAIMSDGFFAVQDPVTNEIAYTRDGSFKMSENIDERFYLVTSKGDFVLGPDNMPITLETENDILDIGVFDFKHKEGFLLVGDNYFTPTEKNGEPILIENAQIVRSKLETSNVSIADEMTQMIHSQRAFQLAARMLQTSDEIEHTINTLRG